MTTKIIVSYDGTDSDRDALALGKVLAATGASVALAYVRHAVEGKPSAERLAERDAEELLAAGAEELGGAGVTTHVVLSASTPNGLRDLALELDAGAIVFGSEYRTAPGHVDPQASARRLLDGGPIAVALAPAGFHALTDYAVGTVGVVAEDGDPCVLETAETIAARHHGTRRAAGDRGRRPDGGRLEARDGERTRDAQRRRRLPHRADAVPGARAAARRGGRVLAVPAEAARFTRRIGRRDRRFLATLAGREPPAIAFAAGFVAHGGTSTPRSDCVTLDQAGVMGGGTWRFCGADAVTFCLQHAAESSSLADRCRRLGTVTQPS